MFSFFKKKIDYNATNHLLVDLHSHLIPGIDDGAKNLEESIELILKLKSLGYKKIITTPHVMIDSYPNSKNTIIKGLENLQRELIKRGIDINIEASAEYYIDEGFIKLLKNHQLIPILNKYILFETSYISKPFNLEEIIFEISQKGYIPILAHPERYRYIKNHKDEYTKLKELGVMFQLNANSLIGYYGKDAQIKANYLIENSLIDFIGSDTHRQRHLLILEEVLRNKSIWDKILNKNKILNNTLID